MPLEDFFFSLNGHRPAVYMNLHPLWFLMSVNFGTLTLRSVHPASPVLLTRVGPLRILYFKRKVQKKQLPLRTYLKFENRLRILHPQGL